MHDNYQDIRTRIEELPTWYDENGCPRYGTFTPELCPNIYTNVVALLRIECQDCNESFDVQMSGEIWGRNMEHPPKKWHYGDPPRHNCLGAGESMNCEDMEVLEVWVRNWPPHEWERRPEFEGMIDADE